MNPLDLKGPDFLAYYISYALAVFAVALVARWLYKSSVGDDPVLARWRPGVYPREADAYGIALMRGGAKEVANTVLGRLFSSSLIEISDRVLRRCATPGSWPSLDPIESEALRVVDQALVAAQAEKMVRAGIEPYIRVLADDLERQGLIPTPGQREVYWWICGVALAAVSGLGAAKLVVGLARGRNVEYLVILLALFSGLGWYLLKPPLRTRFGDKYLSWLKDSHRGLMNLLSSGHRDDIREMALIAGIYGLNTLPVFNPLHTAMNPPSSSGGDSGGCGGGGCGGGGCGGCGG